MHFRPSWLNARPFLGISGQQGQTQPKGGMGFPLFPLFALVNGDNIIVNNATMIVVAIVAIGLVGLLSYILLAQSGLLAQFSSRNDQEYYYPEEGFYSEEDPGFQTRYKRFAPNGNVFRIYFFVNEKYQSQLKLKVLYMFFPTLMQ